MTDSSRCDNCWTSWFLIKKLGAVKLCSSCYFREAYMDKSHKQKWNKKLEASEKVSEDW